MNYPYSSPTHVPPPLPTMAGRNQLTTSRRHKLVLSEKQALPYRRANAVVACFTVVASLLTYKADWGINLPILSLAAMAVGFWRKPEMLAYRATHLQLAVWTALAVAVVLHFDPWTIVPFLLVSLVLLGNLLFGHAVDPMRGLARTVVQFAYIPWTYRKAFRFGKASLIQKNGVFNTIIRRTAFPVFIAVGFGTLYVWSNQALSQWSFNFFDKLLSVNWFLDSLQLAWSLFLSSLVGAALVYGMKKQDGRLLKSIGITPNKLADAAEEWSSVSIALVLVNVMALVLNTVDGSTTWMGEVSTSGAELKRGVHTGTYTLITAIVLAASYLIYNFRVQPKDYDRARLLALAWLGQNLMMVFTVALRNYHYTDAYGLTIKRIGVWIFLSCTATGLYFLGRQVRENGSVERLVRRQAWAVYLVLATAALPNWPGLITHYNYQEARLVLDVDYLNRLRPYNLDVWAAYNPSVVDFSSYSSYSEKDAWVAPITDIRAWDFRQSRRAALNKALFKPIPKAIDGSEELSHTALKDIEAVDEIDYDVQPTRTEETVILSNK